MNPDRQDHDWKILDWTPPVLFVERNGEQHRFVLTGSANRPRFSWQGHYQTTFEPAREAGNSSVDGSTVSPMPGTVLEIKVQVGDEVSAGEILVVVEAMKMELPVKAPTPGRIQEVLVNVGDSVAQGKSLVVLSGRAGRSKIGRSRMTDQKSETVRLVEVGPRDGLQSLDYRLSIETRLEWITRLSQSGLSEIECGAFVRPDRVPAMASSDQLFTKIKNSDFLAWALVPNLKGLERAQNSGVSAFAFFTSATETFSAKNASCSRQDSLERFKSLVVAADSQPLRAYLSCCFNCPFEGEVEGSDVLYMTRELLDLGAHEIVISDTIGSATPEHVLQLTHHLNSELSAEVITSKISLHLHDTHGQAVESAHAGWEAGIRSFDGSAGGIGGCPFAPNASGNVSTESLVTLFDQLGVATGVSTSSLAETANWFSNQPREIS